MGLGSAAGRPGTPRPGSALPRPRRGPDILLFANLGAVQLSSATGSTSACGRWRWSGADALFLHLNPLQEALQAGGDADFSGLLRRIAALCRVLPVPVVAKEVGWGISAGVARALADAGHPGVGEGAGRRHLLERGGAPSGRQPPPGPRVRGLRRWGIPTAECLVSVRAALPLLPVFASGGIRDGVDAALALALGADLAGMAAAVLRPAAVSAEAAAEELGAMADELRIAMFCAGAADLQALRQTPHLQRLS